MLDLFLGKKLKEYQVERKGQIVGTYFGEPNISKNQKFIDFFEKVDIEKDDILIVPETKMRYCVEDIEFFEPEILGITGGLKDISFKVFYKPETRQTQETTVFHINQPIASIIGNQTNASISDNSIVIFRNAINSADASDKILLDELYKIVQDFAEGKNKLKRSGLKKFEAVITKYAPIALSLGQLITQILIH